MWMPACAVTLFPPLCIGPALPSPLPGIPFPSTHSSTITTFSCESLIFSSRPACWACELLLWGAASPLVSAASGVSSVELDLPAGHCLPAGPLPSPRSQVCSKGAAQPLPHELANLGDQARGCASACGCSEPVFSLLDVFLTELELIAQ